MSSNTSVTDQRHNDYVGTDANITRIPGASEATSGHHYEAVFPKGTLYHCSVVGGLADS